jgi:hypothetical protein
MKRKNHMALNNEITVDAGNAEQTNASDEFVLCLLCALLFKKSVHLVLQEAQVDQTESQMRRQDAMA